jgi:hypothetical protein
MVLMKMIGDWIQSKALAFAVAHWELIALAIMLIALAVVYVFTPKWERPILIGLPICSLTLGAVLAYKYLTKSLP